MLGTALASSVIGLLIGAQAYGTDVISAQAHNAGYTFCTAGQYYENWSQAFGGGIAKGQIHYTVQGGTCDWKIYWQEYGQTGGLYTVGTTMVDGQWIRV
jgi:hypothetical protein